MAMIVCRECSKPFSDSAAACPSCGAPISVAQGSPGLSRTAKVWLALGLFIAVVALLTFGSPAP